MVKQCLANGMIDLMSTKDKKTQKYHFLLSQKFRKIFHIQFIVIEANPYP